MGLCRTGDVSRTENQKEEARRQRAKGKNQERNQKAKGKGQKYTTCKLVGPAAPPLFRLFLLPFYLFLLLFRFPLFWGYSLMQVSQRFAASIFSLCLLTSSFFLSVSAGERPPSDTAHGNPETAVVQLLAIGPGAGDKNAACAATGFLVNEDGVILTNAHVVEDARRCLAASPGAKIVAKFAAPDARAAKAVSCDVAAVDELHDLALLRPERPLDEGRTYAWLDPASPAEGAAVAVTGHPAFVWQPATLKGKVIRKTSLALSDRGAEKTEVFILDIPLQRGASGSPVYWESGGVVGVITRQNPARPAETVAVPIGFAIELLERFRVRWRGNPR
jgi:S1-C subfamily serine protease